MSTRSVRYVSLTALAVFIIDQSVKYYYFISRQQFVLNDAWYTVGMLPFFMSFVAFVYAQKMLLSQKRDFLAIGLVIGGSVSNIVDALGRGGVVDYISLFNVSHFNSADVAIMSGLSMLTYKIFISSKG